MGMWTSAGVGYGYEIDYDDEHRLPWYRAIEFDGDFTAWWRSINGWDAEKERPLVPYYVGMTDEEARRDWQRQRDFRPEWNDYFAKLRAFDESLPPPFEIERNGHCDYAATMLLDPDSVKRVVTEAGSASILSFTAPSRRIVEQCEKYGVDVSGLKLGWHVFGYYG